MKNVNSTTLYRQLISARVSKVFSCCSLKTFSFSTFSLAHQQLFFFAFRFPVHGVISENLRAKICWKALKSAHHHHVIKHKGAVDLEISLSIEIAKLKNEEKVFHFLLLTCLLSYLIFCLFLMKSNSNTHFSFTFKKGLFA